LLRSSSPVKDAGLSFGYLHRKRKPVTRDADPHARAAREFKSRSEHFYNSLRIIIGMLEKPIKLEKPGSEFSNVLAQLKEKKEKRMDILQEDVMRLALAAIKDEAARVDAEVESAKEDPKKKEIKRPINVKELCIMACENAKDLVKEIRTIENWANEIYKKIIEKDPKDPIGEAYIHKEMNDYSKAYKKYNEFMVQLSDTPRKMGKRKLLS